MDPEKITYFAITDARTRRQQFGIKAKDRTKHVYVIGKTGMGKSTMLENMLVQDIRNGEGLAFIDPHGASAEKILDYIPEERVDDVLYFAPFDLENPVAFNVMEDVGYDKRHLVVNGLMSAFKKIWVDAWSSRMEYILTNTLLALLEYPDATMLGINKMYTDKVFRKKVVDNVKDPLVRAFWTEEFATYTDRYTQEATPAIQNKVGQFTGNPLIRNIVGQPKSSFDLRELMDDQKIIICNLSKGRVGEVNANLLGSMLITKIYLAAMSRADISEAELNRLPNFYFYVDEFQSFANESFADILSEARKYKLNLTIAHQYIEQMSEEVRAAVFGNVGTMVTFRVGAYDAEVLEKEFAPTFYGQDLVNLGFTQIYLKLMIDGVASTPFSATTLPPIEAPPVSHKDQVILTSRKRYGTERNKVEEEITRLHVPSEIATSKETPSGENRGSEKAPQRDRQNRSEGSRKPQREQDRRPREYHGGRERPQSEPRMGESNHKEQLTRIRDQMNTKEGTQPLRDAGREGHQPAKNMEKSQVKDKGPSEANRSSLRDALAGVLKDKESPPEMKQEPQKRQDTPKTEQTSKEKPQESSKEVPEDVLRKMLEVEE